MTNPFPGFSPRSVSTVLAVCLATIVVSACGGLPAAETENYKRAIASPIRTAADRVA